MNQKFFKSFFVCFLYDGLCCFLRGGFLTSSFSSFVLRDKLSRRSKKRVVRKNRLLVPPGQLLLSRFDYRLLTDRRERYFARRDKEYDDAMFGGAS